MPLPNLSNSQPEYELTIPSSKRSVKFRPFLVKEQKNLLIALESQDTSQIIKATLRNIESCVHDVKVNDLATFDVDYMFTQIRSKSVGESTIVGGNCSKCDHVSQVSVDLSKINISECPEEIVELSSDLKVKMKYPTYKDMLVSEKIMDPKAPMIDKMLESIINCMNIVYYNEEQTELKNETREEIEKFVNSLTSEQLQKLVAFVESLPQLSADVNFKCEECGTDGSVRLDGLADFF